MTEKRFAIGLLLLLVFAIAIRWSIFGYEYLLISPSHHLLKQLLAPIINSYTQWASIMPITSIILVSLITQMTLTVSFNAYKRRLPGYEKVLVQALRDSPSNQSQILKDHGFEKILMLEPLIRLLVVISVMLIFIKPIVLTVHLPMPIIPWLLMSTFCILTAAVPLLNNFTDWNRSSTAVITLVLIGICIYADLFLLLLYISTSNLFQILNQQLQKYKYTERTQ